MRRFSAFLLGLALIPADAPAQAQSVLDRQKSATIDFLDVGQGDAILIRSPEGKTALVDSGPSKDIVPLLRRIGIRTIDLVVVSHHHADHYGGMDDVIREYRPRVFLASNSAHTTPNYLRLLKLVRDSGIQAIQPTDGPRRIELGSVLLTILPQPPEDHADENNNSIGIRVQYGWFSVLLTGDSEASERAFWDANVPDLVQNCTVLKLAHHGSRNGTDARWLALVRPQLAVASVGQANEYGHPHPQTVALLEQRKIPLLRTDVNSTISVVSDGKVWEFVSAGHRPRGPPAESVKANERTRPSKDADGPSRLVNLNTATQKELDSLPGVGPTISQRIIEGRPYRTVDDLLRVKGIGEKKLAQLRPRVTVK